MHTLEKHSNHFQVELLAVTPMNKNFHMQQKPPPLWMIMFQHVRSSVPAPPKKVKVFIR